LRPWAVVGAAGLRYFQDLLVSTAGRATTLFANASTAGSLLAGALAGVSIDAFGTVTTLVLCGATAAAAAGAFTAGIRLQRVARDVEVPQPRPQGPVATVAAPGR
jgi:MFS transporter, SET family, sugar efflux transporter